MILINQYLDTVGDGTGTKNANGDYSGAADKFFYAPAAGDNVALTRMIVSIEDTTGMQAAEYGNLGAALTNGITVDVQNAGGVIYSLTDTDVPVKTNAGWSSYCYDADLKSWGAGNELLAVRWTFEKSGAPVSLSGDAGEKLVVTLNDNLTGLVAHYFLIQGYFKGGWSA